MIHGSDGFRRTSRRRGFHAPGPRRAPDSRGRFGFVVSSNKRRVGRRRGSGKYLVVLRPDQNAVA